MGCLATGQPLRRVALSTRIAVCLAASALALAVLGPVAWPAEATLQPETGELRVDQPGEQGQAGSPRGIARNRNNGSFVVVWLRPGFYGYPFERAQGVYGQRFHANGAKIGSAFRVNAEDSNYAAAPSLAMHADGSFVVVWEQNPSGSYEPSIFARRYDPEAQPEGTEFLVSTETTGYLQRPSAAATGGGRFVVAWQRTPPLGGGSYVANFDIFANRFNALGAPRGTEFRVNTHTNGQETGAQVASPGDGSFVVVWQSGGGGYGYGGAGIDGAYNGIGAQRFDGQGAKVGTEFVVNTFTAYDQDTPDVAAHASGSFVVVWHGQAADDEPGGPYGTISTDGITMQRYGANGAPAGTEFHLVGHLAGNQIGPSLAIDDDGGFVVVWRSYSAYNSLDERDPDEGGVFGRSFDPGGLPIGGDFQVNLITTGAQANASIATDGGGNFVVAWQGAETYGSGYQRQSFGVAARRFVRDGSGGFLLTLDKSDGDDLWRPGEVVVYQLGINVLGQPAENVVVHETVPLRASFDAAASHAGWQCAAGGAADAECTLDLGTLAAGTNLDVPFAVRINADTERFWPLYNEAFITRSDPAQPGATVVADSATDLTPDSATGSVCQTAPSDCLGFFCRMRPDDPVCRQVVGFASALVAHVKGFFARVAAVSDGFTLLRARDRKVSKTRGGRRVMQLYYVYVDEVFANAKLDPFIFLQGADAIRSWGDNLQALLDDDPNVKVDQIDVDTINAFFDRIISFSGSDSAAAAERELARLDLAQWIGLSPSEALARLDLLTCEGFETQLFCGEVSGDCQITATDALLILQMAVGAVSVRGEGDVDGNGNVRATDALLDLLVAVGAAVRGEACNPPPP